MGSCLPGCPPPQRPTVGVHTPKSRWVPVLSTTGTGPDRKNWLPKENSFSPLPLSGRPEFWWMREKKGIRWTQTRKVSPKKVSNRLDFFKSFAEWKYYRKGMKSAPAKEISLSRVPSPSELPWKGRTKAPFAQLRSFWWRLICYFKWTLLS